MKALTLTQPWATLIATGAKRIETRGWGTNYRGLIAIHAAKGLAPVHGKSGLRELCATEPFATALGDTDPDDLPLGAIVTVVRLCDCVPADPKKSAAVSARFRVSDDEQHFGFYGDDRWAWLLNPHPQSQLENGFYGPFADPIPARGALGLWNVHPDEERLVDERLRIQGLERFS